MRDVKTDADTASKQEMGSLPVADRVVKMMLRLFERPASEVTLDATLHQDLEIDEYGFLDLFTGLEEEFGIELGDDIDAFERAKTVRDIVALVERHLRAKAASSLSPVARVSSAASQRSRIPSSAAAPR